MNEIAIQVRRISKQYRIGQAERYKTLRSTLMDVFTAPLRSLAKREAGQNNGKSTIWALDDVSFDVSQGEVLGIIGRNGAGKSTLLKVLARITEPTRGSLDLYGRVGSLLEVGTGFHPELTGRENIYLNGAILGMKRAEIERNFDAIVDFSEIEQFLDTPVKHYSSGMHMRLAFSVAAHLEPEILLVDEVLAVGDASFQKKCIGKMSDVSRQGRTVLFVSHNMAAIRNLCPRTILLDRGKVVTIGPTDEVVPRYLAMHASESEATVELPAGDPAGPGRATCLRIMDLEGKPRTEFMINEPWKVLLEFETFRDVQHVIAAVGLVTFDDYPVITYWTKPKDLSAGKYQAEFLIDVPLKATELQITVGLSGHEQAFYYREHQGRISITSVALGVQPFRTSGAGLLASFDSPDIQEQS